MYQDIFIEESVKKETPIITKIFNIVLVCITVVVALEFVFVSYKFFGIPLVAMLVVCYFVIFNSKEDYDYTYTNGMIDITRIKGKRKRQELLEFEMKDVVVVAKSKTGPVQKYIGNGMKTYDCTSHNKENVYYTMIIHDEDAKCEFKLLFEPSEEFLDAMHRVAPDKVYK